VPGQSNCHRSWRQIPRDRTTSCLLRSFDIALEEAALQANVNRPDRILE
jgi:hypothetical protein